MLASRVARIVPLNVTDVWLAPFKEKNFRSEIKATSDVSRPSRSQGEKYSVSSFTGPKAAERTVQSEEARPAAA